MTMLDKIIEFDRMGGNLWILTGDERHLDQFASAKDFQIMEQLDLYLEDLIREDLNLIWWFCNGGGYWYSVHIMRLGWPCINPESLDLGDELESFQADW